MKRVGNIFDATCSRENLKKAILMASKQKRNRPIVRKVTDRLDESVEYLRNLLISGEYQPSPYFVEVIHDGVAGKTRTINKPRFYPDQCVHWAVMLQIQPVIMRGMYDWSCGSIPHRGLSRCKRGIERWMRNDPVGTKYCLKLDISKFYQSVDHSILKQMLRRAIKDNGVLHLLDQIIDSTEAGLPIGNYTSQWLANFYLQGLDHFVKETLKVRYYARYIDDMVLFGANKRELHKKRELMYQYIARLKLTVKPNWQLFMVRARRTRQGRTYWAGRRLDFLGYQFDHECTIIRRRTALRIMRRARKIGKKRAPSLADAHAMVSYFGIIKHCDSFRFMRDRIKPYVSLAQMKGVVSRWARQQATAPREGRSR